MDSSEFARQITPPPGQSSTMTYGGVACRSELLTQSINQLAVQQRANHTLVMTSIRVLVTGPTVDFLIFVSAEGPYNIGLLHVITSSITHHPIKHIPM